MDCLHNSDFNTGAAFTGSTHRSPVLTSLRILMLLGGFFCLGGGSVAWADPGCTNPLACNYDEAATEDNGSCDYVSCLVFGCTNPSACNFDATADYSDGSCEYSTCAGCTNDAACDYDPEATIAGPCNDFDSCYGCTNAEAGNFDPDAAFDDGSCEVLGCTIVGACNYDVSANTNDGSCDFFSCLPSGCLNQNACNYDANAIVSDGSCEFPESGYDCDGECLADSDGDGVCDPFEVSGCTDSDALNFEEGATEDDGSCIAVVNGCDDPTACNYNPSANTDDGSCDYDSCTGCLSPSACNYDATAIYAGTCEFPDSGYDCEGNCSLDSDGDGVCDPFEVLGCTNDGACNFDPLATELDGSCDFDTCAGCTNSFGCNYDPDATIDDGSCDYFSCITFGCTTENACNFDPEANYADGSCEFVTCAGCTNPAACDYDSEATISAQCTDFESCVGCLDPEADNYDPEATQAGETCLFSGCTIPAACNYDASANSDDSSCEYESCAGCLNEIACNYDAEATLSGPCEFADNGYDCEGNCLVDSDGDGICDPFEVLGCTNPEAVNFDNEATDDDGSCFILVDGCIDPSACNFDESANNDDGSCEFTSCEGCLNESACNYDPTALYPGACEFPEYAYNCDGSCIADNDGDGICNPFEVPGCTAEDACNYDDEATDDDGSCDFITCNVPGCTNPFACNYDEEAVIDDGTCDFISCLSFGCTNEVACNFDPEANFNDGSCEYSTCAGCTNPLACDYDPAATIANGCTDYSSCYGCTDPEAGNYDASATQDDGLCQFPGCTVEGACNFDAEANFDDGSCDFFSCLVSGCLTETACNYNPDAQLPGPCEYPESGYDCEGVCLADSDGDGVCDPFEISGCTDPNAINFEVDATEDNGSCILPVEGCTDSGACNYDAAANVDDGTCEFESCIGCLASTACNYDENAIYPGDCIYPDMGYDCEGNCLSDFDGDGVCDPFEVLGCDDPNAINFDPNATQDDGTCIPIVEGCTNADACNYNEDANVEDESCDFESCVGCLSPSACNFDPEATVAGECVFPELGYGCDGICLEDSDEDGVCDLFEIAGCTDSEACNYDPNATDDNGSCFDALDGYDCEGNCLEDQDADGICDPFELPPVLSLPADTLAECGADLPSAVASGGCSEPVITFEDQNIPGNCDGNYTVIRTWTASDNCGNSTSKAQTIIFQDTTPPAFTFVPENYTSECSDELVLGDAEANDICSSFSISVTSVTTDGDATGNYTVVRTFTATDDCGNSSSAQQTITVQDTTAPEFTSVPADYTSECSDDLILDDATASDNCGEVTIEVSSETTTGDAAGNYVIVRTFTATDDAGNSSSAQQTITVQDTTAPEFTSVPADYTSECSDDLILDDATASDNCGEVTIEVSSETTTGDAAGNYVIVRTFTATDDAGNSSSAQQTITVQDTTAPEFTSVPADYTSECSDDLILDDATASDNCGEVTIEVSSETTTGDAAGNYVIVRTFTATDDAGNSSSAQQTITVQDTTAPEFTSVPADYTSECSDDLILDDATASDNCGEVTIEVSSETTTGDAAGNYVIVRTFTATDDAGNSSSAQQTITVQDTTAPEFTSVPADYTSECSDDLILDDATASDNCGEVTIEVSSETTTGDAAGNYVIVRTFTATDDAGNSSSAQQTITVQDTTAPEFTSVPADYTSECSDDLILDDATASDNCGEVTIEVSSETTTGDAAGNYVIVRTFTATDDAGNSSSAQQTITVQDTTAPEFTSVPADYTSECSDDLILDDATASDNCGEVTIEVSSETTTGDAAGNYVIVRTFTATDDAGNSSSAQQTITVQDTTAPEFTSVPADYTSECSDDLILDDATASDNCGEVTIEVSSETTTGDAAGNYVIVRTFTATDDAGNSSSAQQTITVQDTTAPEFTSVPADYTSECSDDLILDDATASDNCGEVTIEVSSETTTGDAAGNYVIVRTFTATDDAGNSSSAQQTITVQDTTAPEFTSVPADYTSECSDDLILDDATASDNCGEVTIEVSSETTTGDAAGNYVIVRTFTATDDAGNSSSAQQTITVQDTTAPEFTSVPADYTSECSDDLILDDATASDNCGEVTIEVSSETTTGDAAGNYVIVRTFTATDDAGNSSSAQQTITVQDTTAPEFTSVPADYTSECSDDLILDDATASDNCGEVTIEVSSETTTGDAAGNYVIVRTFTATDDAGNSSSAQQTITVQDTTAPEFTSVPADYTSECSDDLILDDATASDNCGEVTIEVSSETTTGDAAGNYVIVRTFTATDDAGNSSSAQQTITVQDTTAPEFTSVPADYTSECSDDLILDDATASDNCGEVTIEVSSETTTGDAAGNYVIVRTFTATDDAGNSSSAQQTITVQDTTAPEFTSVPADYTSECSDDLILDDATASDNCGEVTIEVSSETTTGDAAGNYVIVRTFTATDDAGNSSSAQQTITVQDTTAPEFTSVPADYTSECSDDLILDDATASDNCGEVTIEVSSETTTGDAAGNYVIVRTFTATDDAGNSSSAQQTITVQDTTAPEFTSVPADYTSECSDDLILDDATASDNCGEVTIEVSSETTTGDAAGNYVIVRTFTATDDAGNSSSAQQTITVQDTTAPEFTFVPTGFEVSCSSELPETFDMAEATDLCGTVLVDLAFAEILGEDGAYILNLIYTATDEAGNSTSQTVQVNVGDTVPDGDCDCDGNQLDAIGVCGGDCLVDSDGDGICDLFEVFGCTDAEACNFDPDATQNDGSCEFPDFGYGCDGECLEDVNENGICDIFDVQGCTDPNNPGYNPNATLEDGSCLVGGCLIPSACNYTPEADYQILGFCDLISCTGCTDSDACNYDDEATQDDGSCELPEDGLDCDGACLNDADEDGVCDEDEFGGCTDPTNPSYNPFATDDNGSCLIGGCSLPFACNYDDQVDYLIFADCDFASCAGCTDPLACNYDGDATLDDDSCALPEDGLDCEGACLNDADEDGVCDDDEVFGCTDPTNPGFNPGASEDDGSCLLPGCIIPGSCNFNPEADYLDITQCDFTSCVGCLDLNACNYDAGATIGDSNQCTYPASSYVDCDGVCLNDNDSDDVCDEDEVFGCTDDEASNYNPQATEDNGTCDFASLGGCNLPFACNYDPSADFYLPGSCDFTSCFNVVFDGLCENPAACNFEEEGECDFVGCLVLGCTSLGACNYEPEATTNDGSCEFVTCIGCTNPSACDFNPEATIAGQCDYFTCVGCTDESADNYDPEALIDAICYFDGCTIPGACNFDATANNNDGSCDFNSCTGCQNPSACNFNADAIYPGTCSFPQVGFDCNGSCLDEDGDNVCDVNEVEGCTDEEAINYDPEATDNDGSCIATILGCLDFSACNYNPEANTNDGCEFESCQGCLAVSACNYDSEAIYPGPCTFPEPGFDCEGNCLFDSDEDGICNADEVDGCTDDTASNYNPEATEDDGSCLAEVEGCTDQAACNYDDEATQDDGSCETNSCAGCLSQTACNYDEDAIYAGECEFPEDGFDCDGNCIADACGGCLVEEACNYNPGATFDDGSCEFVSCLEFGCTDPSACNYDEEAAFEDGSCIYAEFPYDCEGECLNDDDGDGVCDEFEVFGCTDSEACNYTEGATNDDGTCAYDCLGCTIEGACNYDPSASIDDGSCDFTSCVVFGCTEEGACNFDPEAEINDGSCDFLSCAGCTDAEACNYDDTATIDNDTCTFPEEGLDCDGNCLADEDGDGVCDADEIAGCTDGCACNYNPDATDEDDSCFFEGCSGCIYATAMNYEEDALFDDGSCLFQGCMDEDYANYNPVANFEGENDCSNAPVNADFNTDGMVQLADLLAFLLAYDTAGPVWGMQPWIVEACEATAFTDEQLLATVSPCQGDDCCGAEGCIYSAALNYDADADQDSGFCLFPGCIDEEAVNFDGLANVDDGTCSYQPCPDFNGDGLVQVEDLMNFLLVWGTVYD